VERHGLHNWNKNSHSDQKCIFAWPSTRRGYPCQSTTDNPTPWLTKIVHYFSFPSRNSICSRYVDSHRIGTSHLASFTVLILSSYSCEYPSCFVQYSVCAALVGVDCIRTICKWLLPLKDQCHFDGAVSNASWLKTAGVAGLVLLDTFGWRISKTAQN